MILDKLIHAHFDFNNSIRLNNFLKLFLILYASNSSL